MEYVQHLLFYFKFSFSSNSFLSLLDSFTNKKKSTACIAACFSRMHDGPFCDDYNIVYNKVKSWVQENFLVSLCLDLPASSIPAIKECFALHLYFTSSSFYSWFLFCWCITVKLFTWKWWRLVSRVHYLLLPSCNFSYLLWTSQVVFTKMTLIQPSGNDKSRCRKLVRKGTLKVYIFP